MKKVIKEKYLLSKGKKYTKLYIMHKASMSLVTQWFNDDIDNLLGSWDNQVKHFENNLK